MEEDEDRSPRAFNPSRAINNEDCRVDWLTHRNIIEWNKRAKEFLGEIKMGKDEQGFIRKCSCLFTSISTITKLAFLFLDIFQMRLRVRCVSSTRMMLISF